MYQGKGLEEEEEREEEEEEEEGVYRREREEEEGEDEWLEERTGGKEDFILEVRSKDEGLARSEAALRLLPLSSNDTNSRGTNRKKSISSNDSSSSNMKFGGRKEWWFRGMSVAMSPPYSPSIFHFSQVKSL